jgi:AraC family transcriptional regulator
MWLHETRLSTGQSLVMGAPPSARLPQTQIALLNTLASVKVEPNALAMLVVVRGHCAIDGGEGRGRVQARHFMVFEPGARIEVHMQHAGLALLLSFSEAALRKLDATSSGRPLPGQGRLDAAAMAAICSGLRAAQAPTAAFWMREPALRLLLRHVALAQKDLRAQLSACPGKSQQRKTQVMLRMQRARRFLETHCDRNIRIAELADMTNFSHWYFTKTFHRVFGESPKHYATRIRLERAQQLLRRADSAVGEVAAACGFESHSAFSRAYRQRFGTSAISSRTHSVPALGNLPSLAHTQGNNSAAASVLSA